MSENSLSRVSDKKVYVVEGDTSVFKLPDGCVVGIEVTNEEKTTISYLDAISNNLYIIYIRKNTNYLSKLFHRRGVPDYLGGIKAVVQPNSNLENKNDPFYKLTLRNSKIKHLVRSIIDLAASLKGDFSKNQRGEESVFSYDIVHPK